MQIGALQRSQTVLKDSDNKCLFICIYHTFPDNQKEKIKDERKVIRGRKEDFFSLFFHLLRETPGVVKCYLLGWSFVF